MEAVTGRLTTRGSFEVAAAEEAEAVAAEEEEMDAAAVPTNVACIHSHRQQHDEKDKE